MRDVALAVGIVLFVAPTFAQPAPIRVHIHTAKDPSGFTDTASQHRQTTVVLVSNELARNQTKWGLVPVTSIEECNVEVEITDAGMKPTGERRVDAWGAGLGRQPRIKEKKEFTITATIRVRDSTYETELTAVRDDFTTELRRWVRMNRAQLVKQ